MTLTEFLLARIAEDEAVARRASVLDLHSAHWKLELEMFGPNIGAVVESDGGTEERTVVSHTRETWEDAGHRFDTEDRDASLEHIAQHDPARVLAECEAKRQIVEWCSADAASEWREGPVLNLLALPYADHPDYDPAWA